SPFKGAIGSRCGTGFGGPGGTPFGSGKNIRHAETGLANRENTAPNPVAKGCVDFSGAASRWPSTMMVLLSASCALTAAWNSFGIMYLRISPMRSFSGARAGAVGEVVEGVDVAAAAGLGSAACVAAASSNAIPTAIRLCMVFSGTTLIRPEVSAQGSKLINWLIPTFPTRHLQ